MAASDPSRARVVPCRRRVGEEPPRPDGDGRAEFRDADAVKRRLRSRRATFSNVGPMPLLRLADGRRGDAEPAPQLLLTLDQNKPTPVITCRSAASPHQPRGATPVGSLALPKPLPRPGRRASRRCFYPNLVAVPRPSGPVKAPLATAFPAPFVLTQLATPPRARLAPIDRYGDDRAHPAGDQARVSPRSSRSSSCGRAPQSDPRNGPNSARTSDPARLHLRSCRGDGSRLDREIGTSATLATDW